MAAAIAAVGPASIDRVRKISPQPLALVGDISRALIAAPPGHRFIVGDFSGVESRVLAWLAGETLEARRMGQI